MKILELTAEIITVIYLLLTVQHMHIFRGKKIKNVQISEFTYDNKADRPIYLVKIIS